MNKKKVFDLLLPAPSGCRAGGALAALRVVFGLMLLIHGLGKIANFGMLAPEFPDPLGVGSAVSLALATFAEVGCAAALVAGLFTRLACLVLLFNMGVAIVAVHHCDVLAAGTGELAFLYFLVYAILLYGGAGRCSADELLRKRLAGKLGE